MEEKICVFDDVYNEVSARAQAEHEKANAFGMLARIKLWDRPKDTDITLTSTEKRYEPFWLAKASRRTLYKRKTVYKIHIEHEHAIAVELLGQKLTMDAKRELNLSAREDCERVATLSEYFDGLHRQTPEKTLIDFAGNFAFHEIADSGEPNFIAPTVTAASVLQRVKSKLTTPIEADEIAEDEIDIQALSLMYRPVYAFQFGWKDKRDVIEVDGLSGRINKEGDMLGSAVRKLGSRDSLFDLGADFAGLVLPGGSIMVKLIDKISK
ncbi:MAG: hypothetical protein ABIY40_00285 [Rhodanobacteraceae bacterium]